MFKESTGIVEFLRPSACFVSIGLLNSLHPPSHYDSPQLVTDKQLTVTKRSLFYQAKTQPVLHSRQRLGLRYYLQHRRRDSTVIVVGKCFCKYFYHFVYYSGSLENAAANKLQTLVSKDAAALNDVENSPDVFFGHVDELLDATDMEKEEAFKLLKQVQPRVSL